MFRFRRPRHYTIHTDNDWAKGCLVIIVIVMMLVSLPAWITHVVHCLIHGEWGFLIAGAIAAPVGVIHGIGLWFGVW